ncbi:MAG: hypothetical protein DRO11_08095, partial [Methanobacteriota archaeon]
DNLEVLHLLTVGKNGIPSAPITLRLEVQQVEEDYSIVTFDSLVASSSSYDIATTILHADTLGRELADSHPIEAITGLSNEISKVVKNTTALGTAVLNRYDKILGTMDIIEMDYTSGDLDHVRYIGDNDTDVYYRDILEYTDGNLALVTHFYNTVDLETESARTELGYDSSDNLITSTYTEV